MGEEYLEGTDIVDGRDRGYTIGFYREILFAGFLDPCRHGFLRLQDLSDLSQRRGRSSTPSLHPESQHQNLCATINRRRLYDSDLQVSPSTGDNLWRERGWWDNPFSLVANRPSTRGQFPQGGRLRGPRVRGFQLRFSSDAL
jgi:hypothetical protein